MISKKRKIGIIAAASALAVCAVLFAFRSQFLRNVADKKIAGLEERMRIDIGYGKLQFDGLDEVSLEGLYVLPRQRDTLLALRSLKLELSAWKLLAGRVDVERVSMDGLRVNFLKEKEAANYDFLFVNQSGTAGSHAETDYARKTELLLDALFDLLPADARLTDIDIAERKDSNSVRLSIPEFVIRNHRFESKVAFEEDGHTQLWQTKGEVNSAERRLALSVSAPDLTVPYLKRRLGAEIKFDSLYCRFVQERKGESVRLSGQAQVAGLEVCHWRLSPSAVNLNDGAIDFRISVEKDAVELDSASTVRFNKLAFHPFLRAEKNGQPAEGIFGWHFTASVNKPWFPADELFSSFPEGLFEHLDGMRVSGELAYRGFVDVDFSLLDSLKFDSRLESKDFRILQFGRSDLRKMSGEFEYTAYEGGSPVRTFAVGPSWNHFVPLDSIPLTMQAAVLQSEDGAFFYHQGFLTDALREAMIYDLKKRKFARGGSTISMQLVKNVFLNRNKNLARKLEEALIVWVIETGRLTSKERMYEVYLNIAEWGPMVYGICEAADYYFAKRPSALTLEESIFLASIIPRPKHFMWSFTEDGRLKDTQEGYFRLIGRRLVAKGVISEAEAAGIDISKVILRGEAKRYFAGKLSAGNPDSVRE